MAIQSINPATEETLATYEPMPAWQVDAILAQARGAFAHWREQTVMERGAPMRRAAMPG